MNVKFIGENNQYLDGVPARDLTQEEWEALSAEKQSRAIASGLYKVIEKTKVFHTKEVDPIEE